ncbi:MAG: hypothetical protein KDK91_29440 [Gammaproteobacteria bacterium]|nr:hypothetical protein [Gammaproteobacteria bacterium]
MFRGNSVIVVCEPNLLGLEHAPVNAAVIEIVLEAFTSERVYFLAHESHLEAVNELLTPAARERVSTEAVRVPRRHSHSLLERAPRAMRLLSRAYSMAMSTQPRLLLLTSCQADTILLLEGLHRLRRHAVSVQVVMHSILASLEGWRSRNPLQRAFDFPGVLGLTRSPSTQFIVLEEGIQNRLMQRFPEVALQTVVLDHPIRPGPAVLGRKLSKPVSIGFIGQASRSKGFIDYLELAQHGAKAFPHELSFHAVGSMTREVFNEDTSGLASAPSREKISTEAFTRGLQQLDYVCLLLDPTHYSLCASGTLLDAVSFGKPVIAYAAPVLSECFERFGNIGYLVRNLQEAKEVLSRVANANNAAYQEQVAAVNRVRESRTVKALAERYRAFTALFLASNLPLGTGAMPPRLHSRRRSLDCAISGLVLKLSTEDRRGLRHADPGARVAIELAAGWLRRAQQFSSSDDGGVARHYSLVDGWGPSYPETTGYIVPTCYQLLDRGLGQSITEEAIDRMVEFLLCQQLDNGAFYGGVIGAEPAKPTTFNTGQILLGLTAAASRTGDSRVLKAMHGAARWMQESQDDDGRWSRFPSQFAYGRGSTYYTHAAWGLMEAERVAPGHGYLDSALRHADWALSRQHPNGWFEQCCVTDPTRPLTHTIAYAHRGVIEAYLHSGDESYLRAAARTADAMVMLVGADGWMPGRMDHHWRAAADWVCLTGNVQMACNWFLLADLLDREDYRQAARRCTAYVRRTLLESGHPGVVGGVRGSMPISGEYNRFMFINWGAKFLIDACLMELDGTQIIPAPERSKEVLVSFEPTLPGVGPDKQTSAFIRPRFNSSRVE